MASERNIAVPHAAPWIRELHRYLGLKNLLFLDGNVLDRVAYPVPASGTELHWTESTLAGFLERVLVAEGYKVVGFFDPADGLQFPDERMRDAWNRVRAGRATDDRRLDRPDAGRRDQRPAADGTAADAAPADFTEALADCVHGMRRCFAGEKIPTAFVFLFASRLFSGSANLRPAERAVFTRLLKASMEAHDVYGDERVLRHQIIVVCDKLNDLPAFLYLDNPRARCIHVPRPDTRARRQFFVTHARRFHGGADLPPAEAERVAGQLASLTDGLSHCELHGLRTLSQRSQLEVTRPNDLCLAYRFGVRESEWDQVDEKRLHEAEARFRREIVGQDAAILRVLDILKRARVGLAAGAGGRSNRPRGVLFLAGPTGVGKTEAAKCLADLLFCDRERCLRFDMSEYAAEHSVQRLLGAPPGYVGYEQGGQLTNAVRDQPFSVLLFDEIEKAHGRILDPFLQILDDGRLTDGQGNTVYFSETIIIFTSNLGTEAIARAGKFPSHADLTASVLAAIRRRFNEPPPSGLGRPEILNRFGDNFVVFDFIRQQAAAQIVGLLVDKLECSAAEHDRPLHLVVAPAVREALRRLACERLEHGGRGIRNLIDAALVNPLSRTIFDRGVPPGARVRVTDLQDAGPTAPTRFSVALEVAA